MNSICIYELLVKTLLRTYWNFLSTSVSLLQPQNKDCCEITLPKASQTRLPSKLFFVKLKRNSILVRLILLAIFLKPTLVWARTFEWRQRKLSALCVSLGSYIPALNLSSRDEIQKQPKRLQLKLLRR